MKSPLHTSRTNQTSGFTLIELLVAVAIISLMSSIVLAFVNETKLKATDRSIELLLGTVRTEAEFYHNVRGGYRVAPGTAANNLCNANTTAFNSTFIRTAGNTGEALTHATIINDALTKAIAQSTGQLSRCKVSADGKMYYIALQRKTSANSYVCTDYTGVMKYITTPKQNTNNAADFSC